MLVSADQKANRPAHVVVVGNEKGGSGKSTIAVHIAIALMNAGQRVATIDLDCRQKSFTRYIENRIAWAKAKKLDLDIPIHHCVAQSEGIHARDNEAAEFSSFIEKVSAVEQVQNFIVIDTPGGDTHLMRLAHAMADTLITPLNDSFVDFDVLGAIDPVTYTVTEVSHYAEMVRDARRAHRRVENRETDWIVVRNRLSSITSRSRRLLAEGVDRLGLQLGFRCATGLSERVIYRELFPRGLTALDEVTTSGRRKKPNRPSMAVRQEVESLITELRLPIDQRGSERAATRLAWLASENTSPDLSDIEDLNDILA
jgi:chromosome partitioning protein